MLEARIQTVSNVFAILHHLAAADSQEGVKDIAVALGLSASVVHRLLRALLAEDIVVLDPVKKAYGIGPEFLRLSVVAVRQSPFIRVATEIMKELVRLSDETVCLNVYRPSDGLFSVLAVEESSRDLQYVLETGTLFPLHAGAGGKVILANLPDATIERILRREPYARLTAKTITNSKKLREQLKDIVQRGYAISFGERLEGAVGIAAPVFDEANAVVASLQYTIPLHRFDQERVPELVRMLLQYSSKLTGLIRVD